MDVTDIEILKILQKNARTSISEIGQRVRLSVSAVGERIRKLESAGVICRYTAILNGKTFRRELTAIIFISLENPGHIDGFLKFAEEEPDILECHYIAGNFDYVLKVVTCSPSTLEALLNKIKGVTGVIKTYTNVVLGTHKCKDSVSPEL